MRYKRVKLGLPFLVISSVVLSAVSCSAIDKLRIKRVRKNDGFVDISPPNSREEADAFIVNVLQKHYLNFSAENWNQMIDYVIDYDNFLKNDNWFLTKILINKNRKILKKLFQVVNYQGLNALNIEEFPIIKDVLNLNDYKLLLYFWNVFSKFPKKGVRASLKNNREFITKFFKNFGFKNNEILEVIKNILFFDQKRIFVVPSNLETKLSILFNKILESTLLGKSWNQLFNFFPSSWKGKERTEKTIKFLEYCFSYFFKLSSEKPNYLFSFNKKK